MSAVALSQTPEPETKRIFGIVPNYRSAASLDHYVPLKTPEKFKIASQDSFDRGTLILSAAFAGMGQLTNANPAFGQGVPGYARYLGTSYADFVIANYMTEAIFPTVFHQDPRYFRKGKGSGGSRVGYAMSRIFVTQTDKGGHAFNISEIGGNAAGVAISNAYYSDTRTVSDNLTKFATQVGVDMASNILKEFTPDLYRKFRRKH